MQRSITHTARGWKANKHFILYSSLVCTTRTTGPLVNAESLLIRLFLRLRSFARHPFSLPRMHIANIDTAKRVILRLNIQLDLLRETLGETDVD